MRKFFLLLSIAVSALLPAHLWGQNTSTEEVTASARILTAIELTKVTDLHFGTMVSTNSPGACMVPATGEDRSATGGVTLLDQTPAYTRAYFTVSGDISATYSIALPEDETVTISYHDGATTHSMDVNGFSHSAGVSPALDASGAADFYVGASLSVSANQPPGLYQGSFNVTVAYE
ncbi:DUF4402 domain-containing protein [Gaoshiqia sp. Z1-71]|uniref:DUF4402 domain-containing protein n=1 Tax=Gaoshiqia hydrogeniformans TaxID=3290090 RepID=UPI003BF8B165